MRAVGTTRWVGVAVLSVAAWVSAAASAPAPAAPTPTVAAVVQPGDLVVADQQAGEVLRVPASGEPEAVLSGLGSVRGVLVLADGAVLATDGDAGTIEATGGRYGDERVEVASGLEAPEALAAAGPDRLYVSSFSAGTVSRVDLATGRVQTLAAGLDGPTAVLALRAPRSPTHVAVAEWFGGAVALLQRNGDRSGTLAEDLDRPAGLAMDGDGTVYVTDRDAGAVVAIGSSGQVRRLADLDAPAGIALDPAQPAAGQSFDLVVATADGIERVDPDTGRASRLADVRTGVGVVVAPDEFVAIAAGIDDSVAEGAGGRVGGDVVGADTGLDIDPVMVGLVALAVFLAGVALVTGVQLWRSRDEREDDAPVTGTRSERRRARRTDRAVQKAERKTAREVLRAEKRAAKMAPSQAEPARGAESEVAGVAPSPPMAAAMPLFLSDISSADADADGGAAGGASPADRAPATQTRAGTRQEKARAKADAKQAKADAAAAEAAAADRARADAKQAKADAKAAKRQAKADDKAAEAQARADAKQAKVDAKAAKAQARVDAKQAQVEAKRANAGTEGTIPAAPSPAAVPDGRGGVDDAVALGPVGAPPAHEGAAAAIADVARPGEGAAPPLGAPTESDPPHDPDAVAQRLAAAQGPPRAPSPADAAAPGTEAADERTPLFASPQPAPQTPGPFLESLFATPAAPAAEDEAPGPAPAAAVTAPPPDAPLPAPPPPVIPLVHRRPPLELAESTSLGDITDLVARDVPPPHGLLGRRRARRRHRAAEHRHQQLRAINALLDVPLPAVPPRPTRAELAERGVSPAASVASPDLPPAPPALEAGAVDVGGDAGLDAPASGPAGDEGGGVSAEADAPNVAVPWPDRTANGTTGGPQQPWPADPAG